MKKVQAQAIMSLDGYVAKDDNTIGQLFDWLQNGAVAIPTAPATSPSTSPRSAQITGAAGRRRSERSSVAGHCST